MMPPDFNDILLEFMKKADVGIINTIVFVMGIILIIFVIIILSLLVRKLSKTFLREDKYVLLLQEYTEMLSKYEGACKNHDRVNNITKYLVQLDYTVLTLISHSLFATKEQQEIYEIANKLIETTVFVIPQYFKTNIADNHRCFIWMQKEDSDLLENTYSSTGELKQDLQVNSSFAGRIYSIGEDRYSPNIDNEKDFQKRDKSTYRYKSLIGVPLKVEENTFGVLTIDAKKENAFNEEDIVHLNLFASLISACTLLQVK